MSESAAKLILKASAFTQKLSHESFDRGGAEG